MSTRIVNVFVSHPSRPTNHSREIRYPISEDEYQYPVIKESAALIDAFHHHLQSKLAKILIHQNHQGNIVGLSLQIIANKSDNVGSINKLVREISNAVMRENHDLNISCLDPDLLNKGELARRYDMG